MKHPVDMAFFRAEHGRAQSRETPVFSALVSSEEYAGTEKWMNERNNPAPQLLDRKIYWRRLRLRLTYGSTFGC